MQSLATRLLKVAVVKVLIGLSFLLIVLNDQAMPMWIKGSILAKW
jgi:hypothetical protein